MLRCHCAGRLSHVEMARNGRQSTVDNNATAKLFVQELPQWIRWWDRLRPGTYATEGRELPVIQAWRERKCSVRVRSGLARPAV
jgi:hypothetical protein